MATRHMLLQSVLFLNHENQGLLFMYDDKRYLYQSTKVEKKTDLKTPKIAQLCIFSSVVCYLLPWQLGICVGKTVYF